MITKEVEIPEGVNVSYKDNFLAVKGSKGEVKREFSDSRLKMEIKGNIIKITSSDQRRKSKALLGTWTAHTRNMLVSVNNKWEAKLRGVYSHFPMKINVDQQTNRVVIQNFLGERSTRYSKILEGTEVEIKNNEVTVTGLDRDRVGQTAANIEQVTRVRGYDKRVFQDGIHLVQKTKLVELGE
ncbi:MAG: 50S ribosomal protein L6 [Nanoarchaeota archaeon]